MRLPSKYTVGCRSLRSFDLDAFLLCNECSLPVFLIEATRGRSASKPHRYVAAIAKKLGLRAFVVEHSECELDGEFKLLNDPYVAAKDALTEEVVFMGFASGWKEFCESQFREHMKTAHGTI
jgi:hypothetical protein